MWSNARLAMAALVALAGCPRTGGEDCNDNDHCPSGEVCGRDHACTDPSNVREVLVRWTVNGGDANVQTCAPRPDFTLTFLGDSFEDELAFTPVPCSTGQFFVDMLPRRFHSVEIGLGGRRVPINSDGTAMGDFVP